MIQYQHGWLRLGAGRFVLVITWSDYLWYAHLALWRKNHNSEVGWDLIWGRQFGFTERRRRDLWATRPRLLWTK